MNVVAKKASLTPFEVFKLTYKLITALRIITYLLA